MHNREGKYFPEIAHVCGGTVTCVCVGTGQFLPSLDYFDKLILDYFTSD